MKKTTKALYSAVAGLAMIAATGNATYASWIDSAPLGNSTDIVQTGDLRLTFAGHPSEGPCEVTTEPDEDGDEDGSESESENGSENVNIYTQVCWTMQPMTPPATGSPAGTPWVAGTRKSSYNFGELPVVQPGYVLTGTTQIVTTLSGHTLMADLRLDSFVMNNPVGAEALTNWLNKAETTVTVTETHGTITTIVPREASDDEVCDFDGCDLFKKLTEPTKTFDVLITVSFSRDPLPEDVQIEKVDADGNPVLDDDGNPVMVSAHAEARKHIGDLTFQLLQSVDSDAFRFTGAGR